MANPFMIQPGGDYSAGLRGLSDVVGEIGERKRQEEAQQKAAEKTATIRAAMLSAFQSKNPDKMNEVAAQYPEVGQLMMKMGNYYSEETKQNQLDSLMDLYIDPSIENREKVSAERGAFLDQAGVPPEGRVESDTFFDKYSGATDDQVRQDIGMQLAATLPADKWENLQKAAGAEVDKYEGLTADYEEFLRVYKLENSPESYAKFQKSKAKSGQAAGKTYSKKNTDGSVRTIKNVIPGSKQERQLLEGQFVEGSQTVPAKMSAQERRQDRLNKSTDKLTEMANKDPNKFYEKYNYRQNDDGSLFIDPISGGPQELKGATKVLGKRGNMKAIIGLGEQWDDAKELTELLELPSVQANLKKAEGAGFWDQAKSKWSNAINKWMQDQGIKGDSPTATAIARIQRMASEERKLYMGTAVTDNEMKSALAWMPNAGDSFDSVMNKTRLMGQEAEQAFRRWVDVAEGEGADMSPFMKAFGAKKFDTKESSPRIEAPQAAIDFVINNPQHSEAFREKYGYLPGEQVSEGL